MLQHRCEAVLHCAQGFGTLRPAQHAPVQALDLLAEASSMAQQAQRLHWDSGSQAMLCPSQRHPLAARHDCASVCVLARRMVGYPLRTSACCQLSSRLPTCNSGSSSRGSGRSGTSGSSTMASRQDTDRISRRAMGTNSKGMGSNSKGMGRSSQLVLTGSSSRPLLSKPTLRRPGVSSRQDGTPQGRTGPRSAPAHLPFPREPAVVISCFQCWLLSGSGVRLACPHAVLPCHLLRCSGATNSTTMGHQKVISSRSIKPILQGPTSRLEPALKHSKYFVAAAPCNQLAPLQTFQPAQPPAYGPPIGGDRQPFPLPPHSTRPTGDSFSESQILA